MLQSIIGSQWIELILAFKDRDLYDNLSSLFIKGDVFSTLLKIIVFSMPKNKPILNREEYHPVSRILELCACHLQGIKIIYSQIEKVLDMVELLIRIPGDTYLINIKYPAATVLLDLSANEACIEKVSGIIKEK